MQVANVTGALKAAGLYDRSVLLFMSDNVCFDMLLQAFVIAIAMTDRLALTCLYAKEVVS